MYRQVILTILLNFIWRTSFAQAPPDICENKIPPYWVANNGTLILSETHFKQGQQSIRWEWNSKNSILKVTDTSFGKVVTDKGSSFIIWILINGKRCFRNAMHVWRSFAGGII